MTLGFCAKFIYEVDLYWKMVDVNAASRLEKSLGLLATRFVNLLQEARGGVLD